MKITGELLKTERLKKNYTVAEVASSLKLSSRIITSIESGSVDDLPAKTFIRGFVKSYAQFLKLDSDLILRQFLEEMGSTQPLPKVLPPLSAADQAKSKVSKTKSSPTATTNLDINQDSKKKTLIYSSMAAVLLVVILVVKNIIEKYQKESIVDPIATTQILTQPTAQPLPQSENVLAPAISTQLTESNKAMSSVSPAQNDPQDLKATEKIPEDSISAMSITTSSPNDFEPSLGQPIELIVEAKKDAEFFYAKGNTKTFTRVKLATKEIQVIRSPSGLHLKAEDGSVLRLILNGVDKGQASASNKPVRLTF